MMYYSHSTGGFYPADMRDIYEAAGTWPADAVELTADEYTALRAGLDRGMRIAQGPDGRPVLVDPRDLMTLDEHRAIKISQINAARDAALVAGIEYGGHVYDSDAKSVQRITGAVVLAMADANFSTGWVTKDNTIVTLTAADVIALGQAAASHEAGIIFKARQLKDQVLAATTRAEIEAITWS